MSKQFDIHDQVMNKSWRCYRQVVHKLKLLSHEQAMNKLWTTSYWLNSCCYGLNYYSGWVYGVCWFPTAVRIRLSRPPAGLGLGLSLAIISPFCKIIWPWRRFKKKGVGEFDPPTSPVCDRVKPNYKILASYNCQHRWRSKKCHQDRGCTAQHNLLISLFYNSIVLNSVQRIPKHRYWYMCGLYLLYEHLKNGRRKIWETPPKLHEYIKFQFLGVI